jgi:AraC family transcriptional regulator, transcriptional activator of pobA
MESPFSMIPLVERLMRKIIPEPVPPHRHNFQEIILLIEGHADHTIDGSNYKVFAPAVLLVAEGKVHSFFPDPNVRGWAIRFTNEFLPLEINELFSQFIELSTIPLQNEKTINKLETISKLLYEEYRRPAADDNSISRNLLSALLNLLKFEKRKLHIPNQPEKTADYCMFYQFLNLLDKNFKKEQTVEFYAKKLNITTKKLGELCKERFGISTIKIIEQRRLIEAKRLLAYTSQTVQEIAFDLGYEDHSYFTKVFRKNLKLSPTEFRERNHTA